MGKGFCGVLPMNAPLETHPRGAAALQSWAMSRGAAHMGLRAAPADHCTLSARAVQQQAKGWLKGEELQGQGGRRGKVLEQQSMWERGGWIKRQREGNKGEKLRGSLPALSLCSGHRQEFLTWMEIGQSLPTGSKAQLGRSMPRGGMVPEE